MLTSLHIENVAVIKSVDIDFSSGFTALTGETGAGKSVIIDSINFLLGSKAERTLVRFNAESAMVSGCFTEISEASLAALSDCGVYPDDDGNILNVCAGSRFSISRGYYRELKSVTNDNHGIGIVLLATTEVADM